MIDGQETISDDLSDVYRAALKAVLEHIDGSEGKTIKELMTEIIEGL